MVVFDYRIPIYTHSFIQDATATSTRAPTNTPKPSNSGQPYLEVETTSLCRGGPSQVYDQETYVDAGVRVKVLGKNPDDGWWLIEDPANSSHRCWMWDGAGTVIGDKGKIPVVQPPDPPAPDTGMGDLSVTQRNITIYLRDHSSVDGDRVKLVVNGKVIVKDYTITNKAKGFSVTLQGGPNSVVIVALNEGSDPPNTVEVSISNVRIGAEVQLSGELSKGENSSFTIYAP